MKKAFYLIAFMAILFICTTPSFDLLKASGKMIETNADIYDSDCDDIDYKMMCEEEENLIGNGSYYGFYDNGTYKIGCTGVSVIVYDQDDNELNRFRELKFVYSGTFFPDRNTFVAKSTEGIYAVYDLDQMKCLTVTPPPSTPYAQDYGFAITPDGKYMYAIELINSSWKIQLAIYNTENFNLEKKLFNDRPDLSLSGIEIHDDKILLLGFMRDQEGVFDYGFVCELKDDELTNITKLENNVYNSLSYYMHWKESGFYSDMWKDMLDEEYQKKDLTLTDYLKNPKKNKKSKKR